MSERVPTRPPVAVPETDPRTANTPIPWSTIQAIARDLRAALARIVGLAPGDPVHPWTRAEAARVACSLLDALISWRPPVAVDMTPRIVAVERSLLVWRAVSVVALVVALAALFLR